MSSAQFLSPYGLAIDSSNNVYVADTDNYVIRQVTSTDVYTLAGSSIQGNTDGSQGSSAFARPRGIVLISSGIWVVADNTMIRMISSSKSTVVLLLNCLN